MGFRVRGLSPEPFRHLFGLPEAELSRLGVRRYAVDKPVGFPCRIEVRDADPGDSVLLLNHVHQPEDTPYRSAHAIFVREGALEALDVCDEVPEALRRRQISLRGFDGAHMMVAAQLLDGAGLRDAIAGMLDDPAVGYLHAHYAARGCFAARIERVG